MKKKIYTPIYLLLTALLFCWAPRAAAVNVQLKITYNGKGVANNDITIKVGDMTLGKGRTDAAGNVTINASALPTRGIDVYGAVQTDNGSKTWDVKGWVTLNDNNYGELKFEDVFNEMGIPAGMFAEAWGLTFSTGGSNSGGNASVGSGSNKGGGSNGGGSNGGSAKVVEAPAPNPEPALKPGYKCFPMAADDFAKYKKSVTSESFDNSKADVVKRFFASNCYDAVQARQLIELITFETIRLDLAKKGYQNCANQGMYLVEVSPVLEMSLNREELRDYIDGDQSEDDGDFAPVSKPSPKPKSDPKPAPTPRAEPDPKPAPATAPAPTPVKKAKIGFRTDKGESFIAYLDGEQLNTTAANDITVELKSPYSSVQRVKIVFEDKSIPVLEKKVLLTGLSDYYVFIIKLNEKGEWVVKGKL